ncbi:PDZ domain-containing protein, partial [Myxococcota bacterium]|nr:PDZ domain-containing protein [Myxococcota bacterium]
ESPPPTVAVEAPASAPFTPAGDEALRYTLRFPEAGAHMIDVTAELPTGGAEELTLFMAVWTPGSYLVREYSRHVEGVEATGPDGAPLTVTKTAKNRWVVRAPGLSAVQVRYRVYARELGVQTNFVDPDLAVLNGAPTFLSVVGRGDSPHTVKLELPQAWAACETGLDPHPDGEACHFVAASYDELVDSPMLLGNPTVLPFEVQGVPHRLVIAGDQGLWDMARAERDVRRVVEEQAGFWGGLPYDHFLFLTVADEGSGGLEHLDSTLLLTSRWRGADDEEWKDFLGLVSHELFHAWNVKRLRPQGLGPFDYEREVYTESLWVAEGLTAYYDDLLLVRAGLLSESDYLSRLSRAINASMVPPGRKVRSVATSSFDAWIKHYRPDEHSGNSAVNYYSKGTAVGFVLDMEIRRLTAGRRSLDDMMRLLWARHQTGPGYTPADVRAAASEVAGADLGPLFDQLVDGTAELPLDRAMDWVGLKLPEAEDEPDAWLGVNTNDSGGRLTLSSVVRDGPAWTQGLSVGDELLAINGLRASGDVLNRLLEAASPGDTLTIVLARRGVVKTVEVTLAERPFDAWTLSVDRGAVGPAVNHREAWLGLP